MGLWKNRDQDESILSPAWFKSWIKRLLLSRHLLKQICAHALLRNRGAKIDPSAFFSQASLISGDLKQLKIGRGSFVGRVEISVHANVIIGEHVCINDGARLLSASHDLRDPHWRTVHSPIIVENHVWIATNAIILPGVTLHEGAVVGAGAVVTRDVPARALAVGNPARILLERRAGSLDYSPTSSLALFTAWRKLPSITN